MEAQVILSTRKSTLRQVVAGRQSCEAGSGAPGSMEARLRVSGARGNLVTMLS